MPVLSDPKIYPSDEVICAQLGKAAGAWEAFISQLSEMPDVLREWRYYNDGKSWLMKVMRKKKTLCWVSVVEGGFRMTCYFPLRAEETIAQSGLPKELKGQFMRGTGNLRGITVEVRRKADLDAAKQLLMQKAEFR